VVHSKGHSRKAPIRTSLNSKKRKENTTPFSVKLLNSTVLHWAAQVLNRQYDPDQWTLLLLQDCANAVDAQTAFETAEAREQSSESTAANVAAAVWRDTIVRENTGARVERLAWLRSMAKSTQTSANSGEYAPYRVVIYAVSAQSAEQTCLLVTCFAC